jgi:hypothetical protein
MSGWTVPYPRDREPLEILDRMCSDSVTESYLRPGKILSAFGRLYPEAWKQVDEFRASRKELGDWPDWCFLPLAGTYAIVVKGKTLQSPKQALHIGVLGALAAWRVTQGIYRFDPTTFDALWKTPVTGDIPTEVLFHLPEWCVYIPTPNQSWQEATLIGFFAHLESDMNDRRTELRLVLDVTGPSGDDLIGMPIHLGKGGVAGGVEAMLNEAARHFPTRVQSPDGVSERLSSDISPLVSLVLYLCSQAAEIKGAGAGKRIPTRPKPEKTKKGLRIFAPDQTSRWEVGYRLGAALRQALSEHGPVEQTGTHASPRPHIRRAHWHSFWVGKKDQPDARSVTLKWLPPILVNVTEVENLTTTVRDVGNSD